MTFQASSADREIEVEKVAQEDHIDPDRLMHLMLFR